VVSVEVRHAPSGRRFRVERDGAGEPAPGSLFTFDALRDRIEEIT
jgi:hypothetical protein